MPKRMLVVILIAVVSILTACQQSGGLDPNATLPGSSSIDAINNITYIISVDHLWISPNPGGRWSFVGRQLQVTSEITTVIQIRLNAKADVGQAFEDALADVTAADYTIEETDDGVVYARGTNAVGGMVIYRDYPEYVVTITLMDAVSDTVDEQYINDWEIIALEGGLMTVE